MTPTATRSHRRALATAAALPLAAAASLAAAPSASAAIVPPADPPASVPPPPAMVQACYASATPSCDAAALGAVNAARAAEGVGPMVLPSNYYALPPAEQLLVLVNLERVDRGLVPITGLSASLSASAAQASTVGADPAGPAGTTWYSVEASGEPSALAAMYDWMYDDGVASPNRACPPACWGHRNGILAPLQAPSMGAGAAGTVWTAVLVNQYAPSGFTWAQEQPFLRSAVPGGVAVSSAPGATNVATIPVSASGVTAVVTASLAANAPLSLTAGSCVAAPGTTCYLQVSFAPATAGSWSGTLTVQAPGGPFNVGLQATSGHGYWEATASGVVDAMGGGGGYGGTAGVRLGAPIVGMAPTSNRGGYWLTGADGGVFSFGDARFYGSTGAMRLNQPIVGMAPTADGGGYWLVARDGGVFSFGDARFYGSTGAMRLNQPIVGMAPTADGGGYWLVARDGGVFSFGDARFYGSTGAMRLNQPVVGMAASPSGRGYWLAASDGGVFSFGDAGFHGSTGGMRLVAPVTSIVAAPTGGYWEMAADGGVFSFAAPFLGSSAGYHPAGDPVITASAS